MDTPSPQSGRRGAFSVAAAAALLLVAGIVAMVLGVGGGTTPTAGDPATGAASPVQGESQPAEDESQQPIQTAPKAENSPQPNTSPDASPPDGPDFGPFLTGSAPVVLTIPEIGVRADSIVDLGLADDGSIEVPEDAAEPGWFTPGPSPGQLGPAVIAGHVDSKTGPGVFYRLGELGPGDRVKITREDGSVATFAIDRVEHYEKDAFPTRAVYGNTTDRAELRLITCSGQYDAELGYLSNTVAYAHLV